MKSDSDNCRDSSTENVMDILASNGIKITIYEPSISNGLYRKYQVNNNLESFKQETDLIICNRRSSFLSDVEHKIYSRDLFGYH